MGITCHSLRSFRLLLSVRFPELTVLLLLEIAWSTFGHTWLVSMLLEVLISTAIFDELSSAGQHIWVRIKRYRLNNVG